MCSIVNATRAACDIFQINKTNASNYYFYTFYLSKLKLKEKKHLSCEEFKTALRVLHPLHAEHRHSEVERMHQQRTVPA